MNLCPIAYWKKHSPDALALPSLTYRDFDAAIQKLCHSLSLYSEDIFAFIPKKTPLDFALFFAAWRLKKAVYPMSFRLPKKAIADRLKYTKSKWIDLDTLSLSESLETPHIEDSILATLIETSSLSKIACHAYKSHITSAKEAIKALQIRHGDTCCLNLPLSHISGIAFSLRCFYAGATLLPSDSWKEATHISMVPTQLYRLEQNPIALPKLKCLLVGGAPLSKDLYQKALERHLPVYMSYGMTEAGSMIALKPPGKTLAILPHFEIKFGKDREVLVRSPSLFTHYWNGKLVDEWFATSDLGSFSETGEFEIIGRKGRQFISGGENIQPEEIERALLQIPEVIEATVQPTADIEFGMRPIAHLYVAHKISLEKVHEKLEESLPHFKIPTKVNMSMEPLKSSKLSQMTEH